MNPDDTLKTIERQNEVIIGLLARLVWAPEKLAKLVSQGKRNPSVYRSVYNALDGVVTGRQLASKANLSQPTMAVALKDWHQLGIVTNVGTDSQPRYKRLMAIPENDRKTKKEEEAGGSRGRRS